MAYNSQGFRASVMPQTNFLDPRLIAPPSNILPAFQQGVAAAGQLGSLADMINARNRTAATQADAIAAENARNKLVAAGSLADLGMLPDSTAFKRGTLALGNLGVNHDISTFDKKAALADLILGTDTGLAEDRQAIADATREDRRLAGIGDASNKLGEVQAKAGLMDDQFAADQARLLQQKAEDDLKRSATEAAAQFKADNPAADQVALQAHLEQNKAVLAQAEVARKAAEDASALDEKIMGQRSNAAQSRYIVGTGGVKPATGTIAPGVNYSRRNEQINADLNAVLNLGDADAVNAFRLTPQGSAIASRIVAAKNIGFMMRPADQKFIESFKKTYQPTVAQPPAVATTTPMVQYPGAAPAARTYTPEDQAALQWAQSNPNDPRSASILRRLGVQ